MLSLPSESRDRALEVLEPELDAVGRGLGLARLEGELVDEALFDEARVRMRHRAPVADRDRRLFVVGEPDPVVRHRVGNVVGAFERERVDARLAVDQSVAEAAHAVHDFMGVKPGKADSVKSRAPDSQ